MGEGWYHQGRDGQMHLAVSAAYGRRHDDKAWGAKLGGPRSPPGASAIGRAASISENEVWPWE